MVTPEKLKPKNIVIMVWHTANKNWSFNTQEMQTPMRLNFEEENTFDPREATSKSTNQIWKNKYRNRGRFKAFCEALGSFVGLLALRTFSVPDANSRLCSTRRVLGTFWEGRGQFSSCCAYQKSCCAEPEQVSSVLDDQVMPCRFQAPGPTRLEGSIWCQLGFSDRWPGWNNHLAQVSLR